MAVNGNSINTYLRNMDYKNRMYGNTRGTDSQDLEKSGQNQRREALNADTGIKKIGEGKKAPELLEKLPHPYGLGQLMDYKA